MLMILNDSHDPFYNQALEEYVFRNFRDDDVFMLWQNAPAVVVGCYQNINGTPRLERPGVSVTRRMTGGGTVYHDLGNLNYTWITKQSGKVGYDYFLEPVIKALNKIGVPARRTRVCDIAVGDQKIAGSARKEAGGRVLCHGTLFFETDPRAFEQSEKTALRGVTNIRGHLREDMSLERFRERFLKALLPAATPRVRLRSEEDAEVRKLRDMKYKSREWIWGETGE